MPSRKASLIEEEELNWQLNTANLLKGLQLLLSLDEAPSLGR
jgi:hypothetical protein